MYGYVKMPTSIEVGFFVKKEVMKMNKAKAVLQIEIESNKVIAKFDSISQASKFLGNASCRAAIRLVCEGYQRSAYGYKWAYAN